DRELRPGHPLLPADAWLTVLREAGLDAMALADRPRLADAEQVVLLARVPGALEARGAVSLDGRWVVVGTDVFAEQVRAAIEASGGAVHDELTAETGSGVRGVVYV